MDRDASSEPSRDPALALRPSPAAYRRALRYNLLLALPLLVIAVLRLRDSPVLLPLLAVAVALALIGVLLYFRTSRIELRDGSYRVVGMLGTGREFRIADISAALVITQLQAVNSTPTPHLFVRGHDGRALLALGGTTWSVDALTTLADDLAARGVRVAVVDEPITHQQLRRVEPALVSWWRAHPVLVGVLAAVVLLGAVAAVVALAGL